jgi:hypothetical protein
MKYAVRCPSCNACGEVPVQFFGLRIKCLTCQGKFVLGVQEMVMTPIKHDANVILEYDSIELFACAKCPSLGVLVKHHGSRFYRCPDCKTLCSVERDYGGHRGVSPGRYDMANPAPPVTSLTRSAQ